MAKKVLGRDLADLLTRARPARLVEKVGTKPGPVETPAKPEPTPLDLPLETHHASPFPDPATIPAGELPLTGAVGGGHSLHRAPASPVFASRPAPPVATAAPAGSPGWFYTLLGLDVVLLAAALICLFTDRIPAPWARPLAAAAVLGGSLCAGLAYLLRPVAPPKEPPSKVRVHLRRI